MPPAHTDEGLVAAATIRERFPATGVLVLSQYVDSAYALRLIDGGRGLRLLLKDRVMDAASSSRLERSRPGEVVVDRSSSSSCSPAAATPIRSTSSPTASAKCSR